MTQIQHVSELSIDRMLAGELSASDAGAVRDHAVGCARCGGLYDDALAARQSFAIDRPALRLPRRQRWPVAMGAFAALAAAVAMVLAWPRASTVPADDEGGVRAKGTAIVGFFVAHGDQVRRGATAETVMPGDRVELFTTTTEPAWFAAISDDATGARSVYVTTRRVAAGREQVLPMSIELDGALGREVVSAVFCATAFDPMAIDLRALPPGCTIDRFAMTKVPR